MLSSPLPPLLALSDEQALRQREVHNAVVVQALMGRHPSASVCEQLQRYVLGQLNRETAFADLYKNHA